MATRLERWVPLSGVLQGYRRTDLRGDLTAGLTTAVMLVPQAMAYAMLAGLPPIVGLYAALVPVVVYALFGSSRELAVGPVAMVSLLVAAGVAPLAEPASEAFVAYAVLLALMVGAMQLAMGVARLGFVVNFLSHPVLSGFSSAAALIIGLSQLKHLLGVDIPRAQHVHTIVVEAASRLSEVNVATLVVGAASIALLVALKRLAPRFPRALAAVVLTSLAVWRLDLVGHGVAIVGAVTAGLPTPSLPAVDVAAVKALLPTAVAIALVAFMESVAVAKTFARTARYEIDANQELIGLGLANLLGSLFSAYPVTGGFSRTAVNAQAGARTNLAGLITAAMIAVTLLSLTPLFYYLPKAALAAVIMTAVASLFDAREVVHLWRVKRTDLAVWATTFAATLTVGIEIGILVGVGVSLLLLMIRTTRPHLAVLGRLPGTTIYRNVARYPEAETFAGVLVVRLDAQLYFANVAFLREALRRLESARAEPLCAVVIDASGINQLDSSADSALRDVDRDYRARGITLIIASAKGPVRDVLLRSGLAAELGARLVADLDAGLRQARDEVVRSARTDA